MEMGSDLVIVNKLWKIIRRRRRTFAAYICCSVGRGKEGDQQHNCQQSQEAVEQQHHDVRTRRTRYGNHLRYSNCRRIYNSRHHNCRRYDSILKFRLGMRWRGSHKSEHSPHDHENK